VTSTEPVQKVASLRLLAAQAAQQLPKQQLLRLPMETIEFFQAVQFANETAEYHVATVQQLEEMTVNLVTTWTNAPENAGEDFLREQQEAADAAVASLQEALDHVEEQHQWITAHGGSLYANLNELYAGMIGTLQGSIATIQNVTEFLRQ